MPAAVWLVCRTGYMAHFAAEGTQQCKKAYFIQLWPLNRVTSRKLREGPGRVCEEVMANSGHSMQTLHALQQFQK